MSSVLWFVGAGASAPFGIPTMQRMVQDFEKDLTGANSPEEAALYREVSDFLHAHLGRQVDLEAIFSVIDSIINWSPDRIGPAALYHAFVLASVSGGSAQPMGEVHVLRPPAEAKVTIAKRLRERFEQFTRSHCEIPTDALRKIEETYDQLFRYVGDRVGGRNYGNRVVGDWPIFTTNYDPVLEHYWIDFAKVQLNTGFQWNDVAGMKISSPDVFRNGGLKLFKLHGSITWLNDPEYGLTEQRVIPRDMKKATGAPFLGQVMLYPIEEKELYVEPYLTMFQQLNRELASTDKWIVIGYSFADRFIREVFVHNSQKGTRLVLLHPSGKEVAKRLSGFRGRLDVLEMRFGEGNVLAAPQAIWNALAQQ